MGGATSPRHTGNWIIRRSTPAWAGQPGRPPPASTAAAVYPRVGGATEGKSPPYPDAGGVYPRVGGATQHREEVRRGRLRSTPAWAGQPPAQVFEVASVEGLPPRGRGNLNSSARCACKCRVYPRVGGATVAVLEAERKATGLPPRGRGNPPEANAEVGYGRSTPRVGGATPPGAVVVRLGAGLPPRGRGNPGYWDHEARGAEGLPPRGRGNRVPGVLLLGKDRSTPAWAGQPQVPATSVYNLQVYPRVGGATFDVPTDIDPGDGLPPRGRGNPRGEDDTLPADGSTPAWAGQPKTGPLDTPSGGVYPRVGGATQVLHDGAGVVQGLPPRGRGNLPCVRGCAVRGRSTPAWAGQPQSLYRNVISIWVYPRVGGATIMVSVRLRVAKGLPPRGRGNLLQTPQPERWTGSTPAWAGQPRYRTGWCRPPSVYPRVGGATRASWSTARTCPGLPPRGRGNRA